MLTRDTESATKCTVCNSWIDKSHHTTSKTVCPTCMIEWNEAEFKKALEELNGEDN
jgi:hypothetical protein